MIRGLFTVASALSLLVCVATAALWTRSLHHPSSYSHLLGGNRYTTFCTADGISVYGPPRSAADPRRAKAAEDIIRALRNDQLHWRGNLTFSNRTWNAPPPHLEIEWAKPFPQTPADAAQTQFTQSELARPLLRALEDPQRLVVAHLLLFRKPLRWPERIPSHPIAGKFLEKREVFNYVQPEPAPWTEVNPVGLPVVLNRWRYPGAYISSGPVPVNAWAHDLAGEPDLTHLALIRDSWHRRLDLRIAHLPFWTVIATAAVLPVLRLAFFVRARIPRRRTGVCAVCGYDLRASTDRCPECGVLISK